MSYRDDVAKRAMAKHGGLLPMHLTDGDSGETVYDNRDATEMAKHFVAKGGHAADMIVSNADKWLSLQEEIYFMTKTKCKCGASVDHFHENVYEKGYRCWSCWSDIAPIPYPEGQEEKIKATYPWAEKIVNLHYNNKTGKIAIVKEYLISIGELKDDSSAD